MSYRQYPGSPHDPRRAKPTMRAVPDVPTAISRLLDATRQLQEALQKWGRSQMSETEVSDIFVTVGNEFHATVAAFSAYNIDMSDVVSFPHDLRAILEECLSEDPTPQNLDYHIPQVRQIIANLLMGLRSKQPAYWQAVRA